MKSTYLMRIRKVFTAIGGTLSVCMLTASIFHHGHDPHASGQGTGNSILPHPSRPHGIDVHQQRKVCSERISDDIIPGRKPTCNSIHGRRHRMKELIRSRYQEKLRTADQVSQMVRSGDRIFFGEFAIRPESLASAPPSRTRRASCTLASSPPCSPAPSSRSRVRPCSIWPPSSASCSSRASQPGSGPRPSSASLTRTSGTDSSGRRVR